MKDILVVDDENLFLADLAEYLGIHYGISNVITAGNGKKAMEILNTAHFDLVLTDLAMPVMDGHALVKHMHEKYPKIPVLVMTSRDAADVGRGLQDLGVRKLFEKPLDFPGMARTILTM